MNTRKGRSIFLLSLLSGVGILTGQTNTFPNNGNVGIGTSNPSSKLEVVGNVVSITNNSGEPIGKNYSQISSGSTPSLSLVRSVYSWSDTWWSFTMGTDNKLRLGFSSVPQMTFQNGLVGINSDSPTARLTIGGAASGGPPAIAFNEHNVRNWTLGVNSSQSGKFSLVNGSTGLAVLIVDGASNVGIGTTAPTHKLSVNGSIRAKEVIVETTGWADFVFAPGYALPTLAETEQHIAEHGHLPGMPSAADVAEQGVSVGELQMKLLQKLEEMTLHQIEMQKDLQSLRAENRALRTEIKKLQSAASQ